MKKSKLLSFGFILLTLVVSSCTPSVTPSDYLKIVSLPDKVFYNKGETFDSNGLLVADKDDKYVSDYVMNPPDGATLNKIGDMKVTISKSGYRSTYFNISVTETIEYQLTVDTLPDKLTYNINEQLDLTGLIIKDQDGDIITDYITSPTQGTTLTELGDVIVHVTKIGYEETTFTISVVDVAQNQLDVSSLPNKVNYYLNDTLDLTGLKITANNEVVTGYTTSIANGTKLTTLGTVDITVSKLNYISTSFSIFVSQKQDTKTYHEVRFNYINDTHGAFTRQNNDSHSYEAGMSYLTQYFKTFDSSKTVLLSGGDMCQGGFESNMTRGLIMCDAMNIAGFDAMVLGNHEFDWGEDALRNIAAELDAPIICCNVFYSSDHATRPEYLKPYTIVEKDGLKVGIIGAIQEGIQSSIVGSVSSAFYYPDPAPYIIEYSDLLRTTYDCDIVVAAMHDSGFNDTTGKFKHPSIIKNSTVTGQTYVDGVFLGHDHRVKYGYLDNDEMIPYLEAGRNGQCIGLMVIEGKTTNNEFTILDAESSVNSKAYNTCTTSNAEVDALLVKYADVIGDPDAVICTFKNSYDQQEFATLIAQAMYWYVNENKELFDGATVYLATHNIGGVRVSYIDSGEFTYAELTSACPFDNELCIQKCTYQNIYYMEHSSSYVHYKESNPIYVGGYTTAVTITYIAENETYGPKCQESFERYQITAKEALILFLKEFDGRL